MADFNHPSGSSSQPAAGSDEASHCDRGSGRDDARRKDSRSPDPPLEARCRYRLRTCVLVLVLAAQICSGSGRAFCSARRGLARTDRFPKAGSAERLRCGRLHETPHDENDRRHALRRRYRDGARCVVPRAVFDCLGLGGSCFGVVERARRQAQVKIEASGLRAIRFSGLTWLPSRP
jgi:hypothetical protein